MKFYMHQRIIGENLIKIGLILSAQWRFSEERYQACPVTLIKWKGCPMWSCNWEPAENLNTEAIRYT